MYLKVSNIFISIKIKTFIDMYTLYFLSTIHVYLFLRKFRIIHVELSIRTIEIIDINQ